MNAIKPIRIGLLFLVVPLLSFGIAHKFYVSVTQVTYSENDKAFHITTRLFIDDTQQVLQERYGQKTYLGTSRESPEAEKLLGQYLRERLLLKLNGEVRDLNYLGRTYDNDVVVCYLEVPGVSARSISSLEIWNEILTDLFEDQQNVTHITLGDQKKSFVLMRDNFKGMLKL